MKIISEPLLEFDFEDAAKLNIYKRQLETLYSVAEGTCPGDRNFGLSNEYQDEPPEIAESTYSLEVYNKTEQYVPQVEVLEIDFEYNDEGVMLPKIFIGLNEEYDEEENEDEDE